jgi:hypothetical protein
MTNMETAINILENVFNIVRNGEDGPYLAEYTAEQLRSIFNNKNT